MDGAKVRISVQGDVSPVNDRNTIACTVWYRLSTAEAWTRAAVLSPSGYSINTNNLTLLQNFNALSSYSNSKYYRRVWHCNRKYHDPYRCKTPHLTDQELQQHFLSALNQLIADKQQVLGTLNGMLMEVLNTDALEQERDRLSEEAAQLVNAVEDGITQNARIALDQVAYSAEYTELALRYDAIKAQLDDVMARLDDLRKRQAEIRAFMNTLDAKEGLYANFDEEAWYALAEYMTVQVDGRVLVRFKNGQEVWSAYQVK